MPTPKVAAAENARRAQAYFDAVAEGFAPIGTIAKDGHKGAVAVAAERLGVRGAATVPKQA